MPKVATGILQPARISKAESTEPTPVFVFPLAVADWPELAFDLSTLLLALDESPKEFRMFFLQVANFLQ
jgi:hypothetical protein